MQSSQRSNRRQGDREPCEHHVILERSDVTEHDISFRSGRGTILNRSERGVLLRVSRPLKHQQLLEITFIKDPHIVGLVEVRWCQAAAAGKGGYLAGCRRLFLHVSGAGAFGSGFTST